MESALSAYVVIGSARELGVNRLYALEAEITAAALCALLWCRLCTQVHTLVYTFYYSSTAVCRISCAVHLPTKIETLRAFITDDATTSPYCNYCDF